MSARDGGPFLKVEALTKHFERRKSLFGAKSRVYAVDGVSFEIAQGETLGLVGESGCGKSTLGRCVIRLLEPSTGQIEFEGLDITHTPMARLRYLRRRLQLIFQDPYASLNPRKKIGATLTGALKLHGIGADREERKQRAQKLLERVGLPASFFDRMPRDLSGGQRQRVGIARALALDPKFIVADEPVSALDVSVQAELLNLLKELQAQLDLTLLFISHDLGVIRHMADRVAVMYLGKLVEVAPADAFYEAPMHPYSEALFSAVPLPDPDAHLSRKRIVLTGDIPDPSSPPSGCRFHTRCPYAQPKCGEVEPALESGGTDHLVACHFPLIAPAKADQGEKQPS
ncbi:ABC transporter ATP-binding protein [Hoeflea sp. G2-23]|uniref:ABC transporter ATP-binding protein n=1 Tax=Hoeflea algicola TaxID=2983763 RepID=A0ABT3ZED2_9HYPH|nr:ABC transporter ATP-binding protein [Hoeflea algicola]MCY0150157.1 ABC transporter ATP-binding protein [Hoeflea algicola]